MRALVPIALVLATGCSGSVYGELWVDHAPFVSTNCRSTGGGLMLIGADGRRISLSRGPNGTAEARFYPSLYSDAVEVIGPCGVLTTTTQPYSIAHVRVVDGSATLYCESSSHVVSGSVRFEGCH